MTVTASLSDVVLLGDFVRFPSSCTNYPKRQDIFYVFFFISPSGLVSLRRAR